MWSCMYMYTMYMSTSFKLIVGFNTFVVKTFCLMIPCKFWGDACHLRFWPLLTKEWLNNCFFVLYAPCVYYRGWWYVQWLTILLLLFWLWLATLFNLCHFSLFGLFLPFLPIWWHKKSTNDDLLILFFNKSIICALNKNFFFGKMLQNL